MQNDPYRYEVIEAIHRRCRDLQYLANLEPPDNLQGSASDMLQHVKWLLPLAEVLQAQKGLGSLYPMVHHAVIELKRQPHPIPQSEYFMFYAVEEGQFELSHTHDAHSPQQTIVLIKVGSAEEVTQTLIQLLTEPPNSL